MSWDTYANVYASIEPMGGKEQIFAGQVQAGGNVLVTIRYVDGVKASDRVVWRENVFEIDNVANEKCRDRQLDLICTERP